MTDTPNAPSPVSGSQGLAISARNLTLTLGQDKHPVEILKGTKPALSASVFRRPCSAAPTGDRVT